LRQLIDQSELSRNQICLKADVDPSHLHRFYHGSGRLSNDTIDRLVAVLGVRLVVVWRCDNLFEEMNSFLLSHAQAREGKGGVMACVTRLGKGKQPPRAIDFADPEVGKRSRIRLGVVTHAEAVGAKLRIEKIVNAQTLNQSPDSETTCWLAGLPDVIFDRIARCGLCQPREFTPTLAEHFGDFLTRRKHDLKPSSYERLNDTAKKLL